METNDSQWHALTPPSKPSAEHLIPGLYALARCWYDRHDHAPAEKIYRLILNIDDRVKNITCGEIVLSALDLGRLLMETDRLMESEHMFLRAINRCTHCLGQDHAVYGIILRSYGELLHRMNLHAEATAMEERAADIKLSKNYKTTESASFSDSGVMSTATIG